MELTGISHISPFLFSNVNVGCFALFNLPPTPKAQPLTPDRRTSPASTHHIMKSLSLQQPGSLVCTEVPNPQPVEGEAIVRVRRSGVRGTEIHAYAGKQPFFCYPCRLGHELCSEAVNAPTDRGFIGDLYAVEAYYFCEICPACRAGKTNCCKKLEVLGVHLDGGHAPLMTVKANKLNQAKGLIADSVSLVEPLVLGAGSAEPAAIKPGEPTVIYGMGPIGLAAPIFAKAPAPIRSVCTSKPSAYLLAAKPCGSAKPCRPTPIRRKISKPNLTGCPPSVRSTFQLADHGEGIIFHSLAVGDLNLDDPNFHRRELQLMASRVDLRIAFSEVIPMMRSKQVNVMQLITYRNVFLATAQCLHALDREAGLAKAMINFDNLIKTLGLHINHQTHTKTSAGDHNLRQHFPKYPQTAALGRFRDMHSQRHRPHRLRRYQHPHASHKLPIYSGLYRQQLQTASDRRKPERSNGALETIHKQFL